MRLEGQTFPIAETISADNSKSAPCHSGQNGQNTISAEGRNHMQIMSAKDAKYGFGRLIDMARSEPVTVEKHGRPVVVVLAVEEYQRLNTLAIETPKDTKEK